MPHVLTSAHHGIPGSGDILEQPLNAIGLGGSPEGRIVGIVVVDDQHIHPVLQEQMTGIVQQRHLRVIAQSGQDHGKMVRLALLPEETVRRDSP